MYEGKITTNRAEARNHVLMTCEIEAGDVCKTVKLRNLSAHGAMVEDDDLPLVGTQLLFKKGEIRATGTVVWARIKRAGIKFDSLVPAEQVKRHVPKPKAKPQMKSGRPGLRSQQLSDAERRIAEHYYWGDPLVPPRR